MHTTEFRDVILTALGELAESRDDVAAKAAGLRDKLAKFETLLALLICRKIFKPTELLSKTLQTAGISVAGALEAAYDVISTLEAKRTVNLFDMLWEQMIDGGRRLELEEPQLPRVRRVSHGLQFDIGQSA